jgi:hypothetical protein
MRPNPFDHHPEAQPWIQLRAEYRARMALRHRITFWGLLAGAAASGVFVAWSAAVMTGYN